METATVFIALCVLCAFWNIAISLMVYSYLKERGVSVSFLWLRVMAPKYAFQYREITHSETGKAGPLFYHWIVSINLALVCAAIGIVSTL